MVVFYPVALKWQLQSLDGSLLLFKSSACEEAFKTISQILDSIIASVVYLFTSSRIPVCFHNPLISFCAFSLFRKRENRQHEERLAVNIPSVCFKVRLAETSTLTVTQLAGPVHSENRLTKNFRVCHDFSLPYVVPNPFKQSDY